MTEKNTAWKMAAENIQQGINGLANIHSAGSAMQKAQNIAQIGMMIAQMI